jgi:hypothetical protein
MKCKDKQKFGLVLNSASMEKNRGKREMIHGIFIRWKRYKNTKGNGKRGSWRKQDKG